MTTTKETAAALRKHLRVAYPATKFSVRMDTGSAYGWLNVSWTDGPTEGEVLAITSTYESSRFSGMDDAYHETGNTQWNCRGVNTHRTHSPARIALAMSLIKGAGTESDPLRICAQGVDVRSAFSHWDERLIAYQWLARTAA